MSVDDMIQELWLNIDISDTSIAKIADALKAGQAMRDAFDGNAEGWTLMNETEFGDGMEAWDKVTKEDV